MNALSKAKHAYSAVAAPTRTPRSAEYEALTNVTRRLQSAKMKSTGSFPQLAAALSDNRRLWTVFAVDVADAGNALPRELRAQIYYLAEFVDMHTRHVLQQNADVEPLIEVNSSVMRGLRAGGV